mgnify:CR=1 FL=1
MQSAVSAAPCELAEQRYYLRCMEIIANPREALAKLVSGTTSSGERTTGR